MESSIEKKKNEKDVCVDWEVEEKGEKEVDGA